MDEDLILDELQDAYLDIDNIDDVPIPTAPTTDEEGVTDGSTSTDLDDYAFDPDVEVTELDDDEDEVVEDFDVSLLGINVSEFVPVTYTYDNDGNFINEDDTADPYVEELGDNEDEEVPDV